jgi:hypothetical protein
MTMRYRVVVQLVALLGVAVAASAADTNKLATTVRGVAEANVAAYDAKDTDGVLRTMHTRSPEYDSTKAALAEQFRDLNVTAKLIDFRYMGHDDEFVVARVKTQYVGTPGGGFQDNVTDSIMLFHQEGGVWKLWSDEVLGVDFK